MKQIMIICIIMLDILFIICRLTTPPKETPLANMKNKKKKVSFKLNLGPIFNFSFLLEECIEEQKAPDKSDT